MIDHIRKTDDNWRNSDGQTYATIHFGKIRITDDRIQGGYTFFNCWEFVRGDDSLFRVSKNLVGDKPSDDVLKALYEAFMSGHQVGEMLGHKAGRKSVKRDLRNLLQDEA
ncbi:hypothetical protein AFCDBAGC_3352 [Methylobacterium cerastii]|uniref:Uncharacterized protein n=1 Tax=Methylobacterium cerastii TaxID=932741 RepID=A0ABQ4QJP9_9HYPH|nr:hypothetical protein [Methylobacterium cerastii]GJD45479.1 hypothetical protein AFCDBAGC_3352 [Methylobacterium cerastii]